MNIDLWQSLTDNWFVILTGLAVGWYTCSVFIHAFTVVDGAESLFRWFLRGPGSPPRRPAGYHRW